MSRTALDWLMNRSLAKLWLIAGCVLLPAALGAPGCGQDIPVVVSLRGAEGQLASVTITPTLGQTKQVTIQPQKPNGELVLYLPASARGTLQLDVTGRDTHECVVAGTTALEVEPIADSALQAVIPLTTQCELNLTVQGNGTIQVLDDLFKCDGHTDTTCTRSFKKGTRLTLMASENGIDSDMGLWEGACIDAPARCTLAMNQPAAVKMTFPRRRCDSSGVCENMPESSSAPPYVLSSDGLWAVTPDRSLISWVAGRWQIIKRLDFSPQALWAAKGVAWLISDDSIITCSAQPASCQPLMHISMPSALYGFGGDNTPRFWAADRNNIYRCSQQQCTSTSVSSLMLNVPAESSRIFNITADTMTRTIVSGRSKSPGGSCVYFVRDCTGDVCLSTANIGDLPCSESTSFRFRPELGGSPAVWIYMESMIKLIRAQGTNVADAKSKSINIAASRLSSKTGVVWLIGAGGTIRTYLPNGDFNYGPTAPMDNLNAIWFNSLGEAWIAGDHGTLLRCTPDATSCKVVPLMETSRLDVIQGDEMGNVWALSQSGRQIRCTVTPPEQCTASNF